MSMGMILIFVFSTCIYCRGRKFLTYFWVQYKSSCALVPKGWALFYSLEGNNRLALTPLVDVNKCGCKVSNVVCKVFIVNS